MSTGSSAAGSSAAGSAPNGSAPAGASASTSVDAIEQAREWLLQQTGADPEADIERRQSEGRPQVESAIEAGSRGRSSSGRSSSGRSTSARSTANLHESGFREQSSSPPDDRDADPESVGRAILIRKLAAQDRTRHELQTAMAAKNVPAEVAEGLLDRFAELGLIDDEAFAQRWVESRQLRRHRSRLALRRELSGKGVDRGITDQVLSEVSTDDELVAARAYVEKVSSGMATLDPEVRRRRLSDRLARRGFGFEVISRVLKDLEGG
jgi:regulatory protein